MDNWYSSLLDAVRAFVAELAARRALGRRPAFLLQVDPAKTDVIGARGDVLFRAPGRPAEAVKAVAAKFSSGPEKTVGLAFSPDLAVMNSFILPVETEDVLQAIIRNKVEGFAPWPLPRSAIGQRIREIPGDAAHVAADAVVMSRSLLEECAAELGAFGITVKSAAVHLADDVIVPVDFGGHEERQAAERRFMKIAAGFTALAACALGAGLYLAWQAYAEGARYADETAALMSRIQGAGSGAGGSGLVSAANQLRTQRLERQPAVAVLNDLSKLLPATVWLESLTLDNGKIELKGQGKDIPSLIQLLESSASFQNVNFAAATQLNAELNADAFSIDATLEQAPAEAPK